MRQKHATCDRIALCKPAYSGLFVRHATVACCRKKVEIIRLSCESMQQSHVAQISPFTQRDFVACRMFLSHVACFCRMSHVFVACRMFLSHVACFCRMSHVFVACRMFLSHVACFCRMSHVFDGNDQVVVLHTACHRELMFLKFLKASKLSLFETEAKSER